MHVVRFEGFKSVTMNNVAFWDVTPCDSCKNRLFGGTYRLHLQGESNQRTKNTLAVASECTTLRIINNYMRTEAIKWDILHGGRERDTFKSSFSRPLCGKSYSIASYLI
jgi:hypothetical protein